MFNDSSFYHKTHSQTHERQLARSHNMGLSLRRARRARRTIRRADATVAQRRQIALRLHTTHHLRKPVVETAKHEASFLAFSSCCTKATSCQWQERHCVTGSSLASLSCLSWSAPKSQFVRGRTSRVLKSIRPQHKLFGQLPVYRDTTPLWSQAHVNVTAPPRSSQSGHRHQSVEVDTRLLHHAVVHSGKESENPDQQPLKGPNKPDRGGAINWSTRCGATGRTRQQLTVIAQPQKKQ